MNQFREQGVSKLVSRRCGKPSNNQSSERFKLRVLQLIQEHYSDFGPALATEKLQEKQGVDISRETVRRWMISNGLWIPHVQRKPLIYQPRQRRDCQGELLQIDGSHHDWFERRSDKCCLLVFIDDETGKLMPLCFREHILTTRKEKNLTFLEMSKRFRVATKTLCLWEKGILPKNCRNKKPFKIADEKRRQDVEESPDIFQYERAERWDVSQRGISHALRRLKIT